jgi:AraC-like DNA-binding protein
LSLLGVHTVVNTVDSEWLYAGKMADAATLRPAVRHLVRARDLADARYTEPLTVDDLAAAACLSRAHFSRQFRRTFGQTPYAYLLARRLERAATLLRGTDYPVADICMQVGLSSVGSFTSSFRRAYGVTPTEYRAAFPSASQLARIPLCVQKVYGGPRNSTIGEDLRERSP